MGVVLHTAFTIHAISNLICKILLLWNSAASLKGRGNSGIDANSSS